MLVCFHSINNWLLTTLVFIPVDTTAALYLPTSSRVLFSHFVEMRVFHMALKTM